MTYYDTYKAMYDVLVSKSYSGYDSFSVSKSDFIQANRGFISSYEQIRRELMTSKDKDYLKFTFDQYTELMKTDNYIKCKNAYL